MRLIRQRLRLVVRAGGGRNDRKVSQYDRLKLSVTMSTRQEILKQSASLGRPTGIEQMLGVSQDVSEHSDPPQGPDEQNPSSWPQSRNRRPLGEL